MLNSTFSDAALNEVWEATFYPRHLRPRLTPELREKTANADKTGGITASDIRAFMMDTEKLKADGPLKSKHNRARLHHMYELDSDAPWPMDSPVPGKTARRVGLQEQRWIRVERPAAAQFGIGWGETGAQPLEQAQRRKERRGRS